MQITMFPTSLKSMFLASNTKENQERVIRCLLHQVLEDMKNDGLLDMLQEIGEEECDDAIQSLLSVYTQTLIHKLHNDGYVTCFD